MITKNRLKIFISFVSIASIYRSLTHLLYANYVLTLDEDIHDESYSFKKRTKMTTFIIDSIIPKNSIVFIKRKNDFNPNFAIHYWATTMSHFHFIWLSLNMLTLLVIWNNSRRGYLILFGVISCQMLNEIPVLDSMQCEVSRDIECFRTAFVLIFGTVSCFFPLDKIRHFLDIPLWEIPLSTILGVVMWSIVFSMCPKSESPSSKKIEKKKKMELNKMAFRKGFLSLVRLVWPNITTAKHEKFERKKMRNKVIIRNDFVDPGWIQHACLYGHKETVKQIISKYTINVNQKCIHDNTLLHLAVFGNHLSVVQILISNCNATLNYSIKNHDEIDVVDLAIQKENLKVLKLLLQNHKPHFSNLVLAIEKNQFNAVSMLLKNMTSNLEKIPDISLQISRFIELNQEIELKSTSKERREICKNNIEVYIKHITGALKTLLKKESKENINAENDQEILVEEKSENNTTKEKTRDIIAEFECPVCLELMKPPRRIYACSNDHYICSLCLTEQLKECPQCRENFLKNKPSIRLTTERFLSKILEK